MIIAAAESIHLVRLIILQSDKAKSETRGKGTFSSAEIYVGKTIDISFERNWEQLHNS